MPFGHILAYQASHALQLEFLKVLSQQLESLDVTGELAAGYSNGEVAGEADQEDAQ